MVKVTEKNIDTWLQKLPYSQEIQGPVDVSAVNSKVNIQIGDTIILNKRPAFLSVSSNNVFLHHLGLEILEDIMDLGD